MLNATARKPMTGPAKVSLVEDIKARAMVEGNRRQAEAYLRGGRLRRSP